MKLIQDVLCIIMPVYIVHIITYGTMQVTGSVLLADIRSWRRTWFLLALSTAKSSLRRFSARCNWTRMTTVSDTPKSSSRPASLELLRTWETNACRRSSPIFRLASGGTSSARTTRSFKIRGNAFLVEQSVTSGGLVWARGWHFYCTAHLHIADVCPSVYRPVLCQNGWTHRRIFHRRVL